MGVIINFDPVAWQAAFPEFAYLTSPQVLLYFGMATNFFKNDGTGPVTSTALAQQALYFATAHFAKIFAPTSTGQPAPGLVGRISDAAEGSVHVSAEYSSQITDTEAFWIQTQYGASFWALTKVYRTFRYLPPRRGWGGAGWRGAWPGGSWPGY
jgi:hypothetical protein